MHQNLEPSLFIKGALGGLKHRGRFLVCVLIYGFNYYLAPVVMGCKDLYSQTSIITLWGFDTSLDS